MTDSQTSDSSHADRAHSELGGSGALQWVNCQGSIFLARALPPQEPNESMLLGTEAHELAEMALEDFLNSKIENTDPDIRLHLSDASDEMKEHIDAYVQFVWKELLEESITGKAYGIETPFVLNEELEMFGTVDFWAVYIDDRGKRVGVICDFKYGYHKVEVEKNPQLAFYACALRKFCQDNNKDLDYVVTAIFQPRAY